MDDTSIMLSQNNGESEAEGQKRVLLLHFNDVYNVEGNAARFAQKVISGYALEISVATVFCCCQYQVLHEKRFYIIKAFLMYCFSLSSTKKSVASIPCQSASNPLIMDSLAGDRCRSRALF